MTIRIDCAEALGDFCHMMNPAAAAISATPAANGRANRSTVAMVATMSSQQDDTHQEPCRMPSSKAALSGLRPWHLRSIAAVDGSICHRPTSAQQPSSAVIEAIARLVAKKAGIPAASQQAM